MDAAVSPTLLSEMWEYRNIIFPCAVLGGLFQPYFVNIQHYLWASLAAAAVPSTAPSPNLRSTVIIDSPKPTLLPTITVTVTAPAEQCSPAPSALFSLVVTESATRHATLTSSVSVPAFPSVSSTSVTKVTATPIQSSASTPSFLKETLCYVGAATVVTIFVLFCHFHLAHRRCMETAARRGDAPEVVANNMERDPPNELQDDLPVDTNVDGNVANPPPVPHGVIHENVLFEFPHAVVEPEDGDVASLSPLKGSRRVERDSGVKQEGTTPASSSSTPSGSENASVPITPSPAPSLGHLDCPTASIQDMPMTADPPSPPAPCGSSAAEGSGHTASALSTSATSENAAKTPPSLIAVSLVEPAAGHPFPVVMVKTPLPSGPPYQPAAAPVAASPKEDLVVFRVDTVEEVGPTRQELGPRKAEERNKDVLPIEMKSPPARFLRAPLAPLDNRMKGEGRVSGGVDDPFVAEVMWSGNKTAAEKGKGKPAFAPVFPLATLVALPETPLPVREREQRAARQMAQHGCNTSGEWELALVATNEYVGLARTPMPGDRKVVRREEAPPKTPVFSPAARRLHAARQAACYGQGTAGELSLAEEYARHPGVQQEGVGESSSLRKGAAEIKR